ncbi:MAG: glycosyl transferase, family 2/group 1 [Actinomycetia bacterium]|nr:glycosyl transferase, family 2/group 1 [Actinomycetes bacterium]
MIVLTAHSSAAAASRLRMTQYFPALRAAGLEPNFWSFLGEHDEVDWVTGTPLVRIRLLLRGMVRLLGLVRLLRGADVVVVHREVLPLGPPVVERLARRGRRMVWDVDDAVWEHHSSVSWLPRWFRAPAGKYERLCRDADEVWAGSEVLAQWCRERNEHVEMVPTVIDVPDERPVGVRGRVVVWVGTPTTAPFVDAVLPAVLALEPTPEVVVVGHGSRPEGLDAVEVLRWSEPVEHEVLERGRVGLYPIDRRHPLADGKCGLKAILYLAHGVVPIVTPTPTNAVIVHDGVHGLHADSEAAWAAAVDRLLVDDELWERLSVAGHAWVREHYSLATWGPVVARRLADLAAR